MPQTKACAELPQSRLSKKSGFAHPGEASSRHSLHVHVSSRLPLHVRVPVCSDMLMVGVELTLQRSSCVR